MTSSKLNTAFGGGTRKKREAAEEFISKATEEQGKKPAYKEDGTEAVSARSMCLSLSVRQDESIGKLSVVLQKSKAAIVREAIDMYLKRHRQEIEKYDAFFGS